MVGLREYCGDGGLGASVPQMAAGQGLGQRLEDGDDAWRGLKAKVEQAGEAPEEAFGGEVGK